MTGGTYELGSVFKTLTIAMAFDEGLAQPDTMIDVRQPLEVGRFTVTDFHPAGRPLSVTEILHAFLERRRGNAGAAGGTGKARSVFAQVRNADADARPRKGQLRRRRCHQPGIVLRRSRCPTGTASPSRLCNSRRRPRRSSTAASRCIRRSCEGSMLARRTASRSSRS